jgi:hypothetical protein
LHCLVVFLLLSVVIDKFSFSFALLINLIITQNFGFIRRDDDLVNILVELVHHPCPDVDRHLVV